MRQPLVLLGASGFAREVLNWINFEKYSVAALFSEDAQNGMTLFGVPIVNDLSKFARSEYIAAVGNPEVKKKLVGYATLAGLKPTRPIIHVSSIIGSKVFLGDGTIICPMSVITTHCEIGENVTVNLSCTIGHDSKVGNWSTISPGANISGNTTIGEGCYIGTGSAIRERLTIGDGAVLGMGGVLTKSIPSGETWVGNPARPILKPSVQ